MSSHELAVAFGYLGATLGVSMVVPQIVGIVRHSALPGVSPLSWAMTSLACLSWMTYGIRTGATPQIPGNILLVSGAIAVVLLASAPMPRHRRGLLIASAAGALLTVAWLIPAHSVGYLAFAVGLFSNWPQLFDSFGNWREHVSSGVSVSAWGLRIGSQVCWLAYAIGTDDVPVGIACTVAMSTAIATVAFELAARTSFSSAAAPETA